MQYEKSRALWERANQSLVGGVNSPVRAFKAVGGHPFFAVSGKGSRVIDADGNSLVDYVLSWGPLVIGHAHPHVVEAVTKALEKGSSFGIPTEAEIVLAEKIRDKVPSMEKVRLVNSGTEATMSAIRLARGFTGRDLLIKIEGCYHGHADGLLVKAGSGLTTFGVPTSPGVPAAYASCTITIPYNDLDAARKVFEEHGKNIACLALEPVPGNMGLILPEPGYLEGLRALTTEYGALLFFDEVMTGFRVSMGGVQEKFGVTPDLTALGKVIGGGLPLAAYGGRADIMEKLSPLGPVYQAGTLSGNPLATAAGLATLEVLEQPGVFDAIEQKAKYLGEGVGAAAKHAGIPVYQTQLGSMACLFFHDGPVRNYTEALKSDTARYGKFFWGMLERGCYFAPAQFEAFFLSNAHSTADLDQTIAAADATFKTL